MTSPARPGLTEALAAELRAMTIDQRLDILTFLTGSAPREVEAAIDALAPPVLDAATVGEFMNLGQPGSYQLAADLERETGNPPHPSDVPALVDELEAKVTGLIPKSPSGLWANDPTRSPSGATYHAVTDPPIHDRNMAPTVCGIRIHFTLIRSSFDNTGWPTRTTPRPTPCPACVAQLRATNTPEPS